MCGICGIAIAPNSGRHLDVHVLERMRDVLSHRGPDGAGTYVGGRVGLGHRRLSIVDVAQGAQPMSSDDGRFHVVYNGEVYNHPSLKAELESEGERYRTHCDTETVLRVLIRDGAAAPRRLRGMFAFAVWDSVSRELILARDRLGVKPLYYAHLDDGSLYFASEIKSILASGAIAPELHLSVLPDQLANHATTGTETLFRGIRRLAPGHVLRWRDGTITIERYWQLSFAHEASGQADALVEDYSELFHESVRMRLMADVPLGVFLSGGLDSAAIASAMTRFVDGPIKTFSVGFAEREANELGYARIVAKHFRTDHHEILVTPLDFFTALPELLWHEDEPLGHPSSIALNFVSRLAAQHVKVVLTGEGSDETLAGYARYRSTIAQMQFGRRYEQWAPDVFRRRLRDLLELLPPRSRIRRMLARTFVGRPATLSSLYFDNFAVFTPQAQEALFTSARREEIGDLDPYRIIREAFEQSDASSMLGRLLDADIQTYLPELLMKQDQMSMAASIESRVPFLDHELVQFAASLPDELKLRRYGTKYALRRAMSGVLPNEILKRKKMGFPVPVARWFRGPYRHIVDEFVLGPRPLARGLFDADAVRAVVERDRRSEGPGNHWERIWALVNLEIWQRIHFDRESTGDIARWMSRACGAQSPFSLKRAS